MTSRNEKGEVMEITVLPIIGKVVLIIERDGDDELRFFCADGSVYKMDHYQDCCERVEIEDICGDLDDLIGAPVLLAEQRCSHDAPNGVDYRGESDTWTFYEFATIKGSVTIRWHGSSNGYYSETACFKQIAKPMSWPTLSTKP